MSIQNIGSALSGVPADQFNVRLQDHLNEAFFSDEPLQTKDLRQIVDRVRKRLSQHPNMRLMLLIDEADDFLAQDSTEGFRRVVELKRLTEPPRQVKVVFAGLNGVQRYQHYRNQPFAQLGKSIVVTPLEPVAAEQLIKQPMRELGYLFEDQTAVLRILSYTNYHPALIQYFCQELLRDALKSRAPKLPPYIITNKRVKELYAREDTKVQIRSRFEWTINVNPLFPAIIWFIADYRISKGSEKQDALSIERMRDEMQYVWPAAFASTTHDEMKELLEELCQIGLLLHVGEGYQLRNPNLIDIIADPAEIKERVYKLEDEPAPASALDPNNHRQKLARTPRRSPLTLAQISTLTEPSYGMGIIIGSRALGLDDIVAGIRSGVEITATDENSSNEVEEVNTTLPSMEMEVEGISPKDDCVSRWMGYLEERFHEKREQPRLVLVVDPSSIRAVESILRASLEFCNARQQARKTWIRVLLKLSPQHTWEWLRMAAQQRETVTGSITRSVALCPWHASVIRTHFHPADSLGSQSLLEDLRELTGGWPFLLDEVYRRSKDTPSAAKQHAVDVTSDLNSNTKLRRDFISATGLESLLSPALRNALADVVSHEAFDADTFAEIVNATGPIDGHPRALLNALEHLQLVQRTALQFQFNTQIVPLLVDVS